MKRLRFKFSLRFILVLILLAAVACVPQTHRAMKQRELAIAVARLGGTISMEQRDSVPKFIRPYINQAYGKTITEIELRAHVAPIFSGWYAPAVLREELQELLTLSAMKQVKVLDLYGTAFDDDFVRQVKETLPNIKVVLLMDTAVNNNPFQTQQPSNKSFQTAFGLPTEQQNGDDVVKRLHSHQLKITSDLPLFTKAIKGHLESINSLIDCARNSSGDNLKSDMQPVLESVALADGDEATLAVRKKAKHENAKIRMLAVMIAAVRGDAEALQPALGDVDKRVRHTAINELRRVPEEAIRECDGMLAAVTGFYQNEDDHRVRWLAIDQTVAFQHEGKDLLLSALKDESSFVRAAAARSLGIVGDSSVLDELRVAQSDNDSFVRKHATSSIQAIEQNRVSAVREDYDN